MPYKVTYPDGATKTFALNELVLAVMAKDVGMDWPATKVDTGEESRVADILAVENRNHTPPPPSDNGLKTIAAAPEFKPPNPEPTEKTNVPTPAISIANEVSYPNRNNEVKMTWKLFFSFEGRIGRKTFWIASFVHTVALVLLYGSVIALVKTFRLPDFISGIAFLVWFYSVLAVQSKRWHDHGASGLMNAIMLIPFLGQLIGGIVLGCIEGTSGPNKYGEDPLKPNITAP